MRRAVLVLRPSRRHVAARGVAAWLVVAGAAGTLRDGPRVRAAPPADLVRAADDLDDDRFPVRRAAEATLERTGRALLAAPASGEGGDAQREEQAAWDGAIGEALRRGGSPAAAARRVLRRLEAEADDEQALRMPRLLAARLARRLPELALPRKAGGGEILSFGLVVEDDRAEERAAARAALLAVSALMPAARAAILETVREASDPRLLAGAVLALTDAEGAPPTEDDAVAALVAAWDRAPELVARLAAYDGPHGVDPLSAVALALVIVGRSPELARLRALAGREDDPVTFDAWLREYVRSTEGLAEFDTGGFLARVEEGAAAAPVEREAARRALRADLPWLARLLARRALFLARDDAESKELLAIAYERLGLAATARAVRRGGGEGEVGPIEGAPADDPGAAVVEASIVEGRLSTRLVFSRECGTAVRVGVVAAATHGDVLVHGTTDGSIVCVDRASGDERSIARTGRAGLPSAIARRGDAIHVLNAAGEHVTFALGRDGVLTRTGPSEPGPFHAVAVAESGEVWLVAQHRRVYQRDGDGPAVLVKAVPTIERYRARRIALLAPGRLMLHDERGEVGVVDVETGVTEVVVRAHEGARAVAASGGQVLVAFRDGWARYDASGRLLGRVATEDGSDVVGIGGDVGADLVVTVAPDRTIGYALDGTVRFDEQLGGSGNPVVGDGLVVVPVGSGLGPVGDGRVDRTIHVLRAGTTAAEPFPVESRVRAVELAVTAALEGRDDVATALLDPVSGWFTATEERAAAAALSEARATRRARPRAPELRGDD